MKEHFLQSSIWEKYQQLEGHQTFRLNGKDFSAFAILETTPLGNYLYCPYGPTLKSPNAIESALNSLSQLARENHAFFIRIEPTIDLSNLTKPLKLTKSHDLNPAHTWKIDLTQPETAILKAMRGSNVQYWRSHQKKGMSIRQTKDPAEITILTKLLQKVGEKDHFNPQAESHLKNQLQSGFATLYVAEYEDKPLAAALVYDYDQTRFYAHAASSDEHRKLAAGTVLLVQIILDAKNNGANTFDFWGITTSEDRNHPWYGFSQYKKSFGGELVTYSGTWDLPLNSLRYHFYQVIRRLNRLKHKILH